MTLIAQEGTLELLVKQAIENGVPLQWHSLLFVFLIAVVAGYVGSYVRQKGQNLATKEDVALITEKVEGVRTAHAKDLENYMQQNRFALACLDRRLEVHQKAWTLWSKLMRNVHHEEKRGDAIMECQEFWLENCLFLDPKARRAFRAAYGNATHHKEMVRDIGASATDVRDNFRAIKEAGWVVAFAIDQIGLSQEEKEHIEAEFGPNPQ